MATKTRKTTESKASKPRKPRKPRPTRAEIHREMKAGRHPEFEIIFRGDWEGEDESYDFLNEIKGARLVAVDDLEFGTHPRLEAALAKYFLLYRSRWGCQFYYTEKPRRCVRDWYAVITDTRDTTLQAGDVVVLVEPGEYLFVRPKFDWGFQDEED